MTNVIEEAEIINKYLCQIKKSLPLGIRLKRDELNDIMDEIEEHIWEKAIANAGDKEPNEIDIQIAISQMGEPQDIAGKFTSRSTPHIYISEELYPYYRKYRKILFWSTVLSIIIYMMLRNLFSLYDYSFQLIIFYYEMFTILVIFFTFFAIIGIVFCYLSITGYIPYELRKSKMQRRYSNLTQIQKPKFKSSSQTIVLSLEISFFLFNAIFLTFWGVVWGAFFTFFLYFLSIVKCLRGFTKTKSVIWQRSLILLDVFLMGLLILGIEGQYMTYNIVDYGFWSWHYFSEEIIYFIIILWMLYFFYIYYEVYLFTVLKEKLQLYLKELSLIKRINKKEIILGSIKNHESPNSQNTPLKHKIFASRSNKYNHEIEECFKIYLKTAKKKLPFWLKKAEKHELIKNIEEEIRETICEYEESNLLTLQALKQFLTNLGSIKTLISECKQRGIPKIFISKELRSWYLTLLKSVSAYFMIITVFIIVLQTSLNVSFTFFNYFAYFIFFWFIWILILILVTQLFVFLSSNDVIPEDNEFLGTKKNRIPIYKLYNIWEALFAEFYIVIGTILIFVVFFGVFSINFPGSNFVLLISGSILLLGGIKTSKIVFRQNKGSVKSILIVLCLGLSIVMNFFIFYNLNSEYRLIFSNPSSRLLNVLFLPINIEIIYEIFHLFFKNKKLSE